MLIFSFLPKRRVAIIHATLISDGIFLILVLDVRLPRSGGKRAKFSSIKVRVENSRALDKQIPNPASGNNPQSKQKLISTNDFNIREES